MTNKPKQGGTDRGGQPVGVWNRGSGKGPSNPIRVRTKRLDEINGDKIALAYWLLAKQIVDNGSDELVTEDEARKLSAEIDSPPRPGAKKPRKRRS